MIARRLTSWFRLRPVPLDPPWGDLSRLDRLDGLPRTEPLLDRYESHLDKYDALVAELVHTSPRSKRHREIVAELHRHYCESRGEAVA